MSRFNVSTKDQNITENYEGVKAYKVSPEMELYTAICTASLQNKFYESADNYIQRLRKLLSQVDADFVQKLTIYTREQMYLRSVPLVVCAELAKQGKLNSATVERIIQRVDEITELLAYYQQVNQRTNTKKLNKLSKAIKEGIKRVFESNKFDEYQFAKYNRATEIKLRDAIFLTHPKAQNPEMDLLFKKIIEDKLETPYTWETQLSEKGNTKKVWEALIDSKKVGYMAIMRNLRNILQASVSGTHIQMVSNFLTNFEAIKKSKQFPFRFLAAYRELKKLGLPQIPYILEALETAILKSVENLEGFELDTTVLIACDVSGSMQKPISEKSSIQNYDIGLILGMLLQSKCKSVISGMFGDTWKVIQVPRTNILSNVDEFYLREGEVGYSTNGWKVLDWIVNSNKKVDKVMMFTDCQMWDSSSTWNDNSGMPALWNQVKQGNPTAKLYLFDLAGYGHTPLDIRQKDVYLITGWSDKIFNVLANIEKGKNVLTMIKNYT